MGNLSYYFDNKDFVCHCSECKGKEYKIHLGLVGALEMITNHFQKKPQILESYWCESYAEKAKKEKRTYHDKGKAAIIRIDGVPLPELFKFAETLDEIRGIGYYPEENALYIDTRREDREEWVKENNKYLALTPEKRTKYSL